MTDLLHKDWKIRLKPEFDLPYFTELQKKVDLAYKSSSCYPAKQQIFEAFNSCSFEKIKVVLLGQDPYHGAGQAQGLAFSVPIGQKFPPSLRNVFKELLTDIPGYEVPLSGDLSAWANEGVFLLNAILTVESSQPGSHSKFGWEKFTDAVISLISKEKEHVAFLLWGNYAQSKSTLIDESKHLILKAAHPSPLARGAFFGSKPFSKTNAYLKQNGLTEINWHL